MNTTRNETPFLLHSTEEKEIVANALVIYMDYLTQLGEGAAQKETDVFMMDQVKDMLGGIMKETIALRQRLVKHVGYDPTHDNAE